MRPYRRRLVSRLIRASVPLLNVFRRPPPFPFSLTELRRLPTGTLGAATTAFLDTRQLAFLPQYETHDVFHTLLGYDTTNDGELRLQAFMLGNRSASVAGRVLLVLGIVLLPELWSQLRRDFRRGRRAGQLSRLDVAAALRQNLGDLRTHLHLS